MKCTGKEWDTCRIEKMGCAGCYYDENSIKEITKKDYVLTNLSLEKHCFTIRLKDDKEYIVYHRRPRGQKTIYFIIKDNKEILLDEEVKKCFLSEVRVYNHVGI